MINDYMREQKQLYQKLEKLEGEINQSLSERYKQMRVENKKLKECLKRFVSYNNQAKELVE